MKVKISHWTRAAVALGAAAVLGTCGSTCSTIPDTDAFVPFPGQQLDQRPSELDSPASPPDREARRQHGLLRDLLPNGKPDIAKDPDAREARVYYDKLAYPFAVEQLAPDVDDPTKLVSKKTAPLTLDRWKEAFNFPLRMPGETLQDYRDRTGIIVYYNRNELGLGRELGCSQFIDGYSGSVPRLGEACFVTNYGPAFNDTVNALQAAVEGHTPKNTVCISYRPTMPPGTEVQFYVYGQHGERQDWAQLDLFGPRAHPAICTGCHGGQYQYSAAPADSAHLTRGSRFLPINPNVLVFADDSLTPGGPPIVPGAAPGVTRAGQEERIRRLNIAALRSPLTAAQRNEFIGLYDKDYDEGSSLPPYKIDNPGQPSTPEWVPVGWRTSDYTREFYKQVVRPNCATCHNALGSSLFSTYNGFKSATFIANYLIPDVKSSLVIMPNAQPTLRRFWVKGVDLPLYTDPADGKTRGGSFVGGADATFNLLTPGWSRFDPATLDLLSTLYCTRSGAPDDSLCGDAHSGSACSDSGFCKHNITDKLHGAAGWCKTAGGRGCAPGQECRPAATPSDLASAGYDGACFACGEFGQESCKVLTPACNGQLREDAATCVDCTSTDQCSSGLVCDTINTRRCVECVGDVQCSADKKCDVTRRRCEDRCASGTFFDAASGLCAACLEDAHCGAGGTCKKGASLTDNTCDYCGSCAATCSATARTCQCSAAAPCATTGQRCAGGACETPPIVKKNVSYVRAGPDGFTGAAEHHYQRVWLDVGQRIEAAARMRQAGYPGGATTGAVMDGDFSSGPQDIGIKLYSPAGTLLQDGHQSVVTTGGRTWNIQTVAAVASATGWYLLEVYNVGGATGGYVLDTYQSNGNMITALSEHMPQLNAAVGYSSDDADFIRLRTTDAKTLSASATAPAAGSLRFELLDVNGKIVTCDGAGNADPTKTTPCGSWTATTASMDVKGLAANAEYVLRVFSRNVTGNGSSYSLTTSNHW